MRDWRVSMAGHVIIIYLFTVFIRKIFHSGKNYFTILSSTYPHLLGRKLDEFSDGKWWLGGYFGLGIPQPHWEVLISLPTGGRQFHIADDLQCAVFFPNSIALLTFVPKTFILHMPFWHHRLPGHPRVYSGFCPCQGRFIRSLVDPRRCSVVRESWNLLSIVGCLFSAWF